MSQTDCSCGSPVAEDYERRPIRTFDFIYTNVLGNLTAKWPPLLFAPSLWSLSKVKVMSFLMGLTLMFFVMASYLLAWDKEGFLFTASPEQLRPVVILSSPPARAAPDVPSDGLLDVKPLAHTINSKLEYTPRTLPDEKDVFEADSQVSRQRVIHRSR